MGGRTASTRRASHQATPEKRTKSLKITATVHRKLMVLSAILDMDTNETIDWLCSLEGHEELRRMRSALRASKEE